MTSPKRLHWIPALSLATGLLLVPLAFASHALSEVVDNSEYVTNSMEPLIDDPTVQQGLVDTALTPLTDAFTSEAVVGLLLESAGLEGIVPGELSVAAEALLQPLIDELVARVELAANTVVASDAFAESWRTAVGDAHRSFRDAMTEGGPISIELPVGPFLEQVRDDLATGNFEGLSALPIPEVSVPLFELTPPDQWREGYQFVSTWQVWLTVLAIALVGLGVWFSPRRDITWLIVGITVPTVLVGPILVAQWWLSGLDASLPVIFAGALLPEPLRIALWISAVTVAVAAVGWFVDRRASRLIA